MTNSLWVQYFAGAGIKHASVIAIIVFDRMAGDMLAPDDAPADAVVARLGETRDPIALGRDRLAVIEKAENEVVDATMSIIGPLPPTSTIASNRLASSWAALRLR